MSFLGDFTSQQTIYCFFNTHKADGTPITLAGTPAISVYKDDGTTETTTGPTLTVDFDSRTGVHCAKIATTDAFYATGHDYKIVITTGTVDSVSVVGMVVGEFSIENRISRANVIQLLGTALTESVAGYLAAAFKKLFDVASPALTAESVNQSGDVLGTTGKNAIADAILTRSWASVTYTGTTRCVLTALQAIRNKFTAAAGAGGYSVKKEDDSTESWAGTLTVDGDGNITGMDPDS